MFVRKVAVVCLAIAFAGCGGGGYSDYDYSPAAIGLASGVTAETAKTDPAPSAKPPAIESATPKSAPVPKTPAEFVKALPANPRTMTDGLVRSRDWKALGWANPANVSPWKKRKNGDDVVLAVILGGGDGDKTAVSRPVSIAADAKGELRMDVYNGGSKDVPISFGVFASVDRVYSESAARKLKPGWNRVVFDLSAPTFKTATSEWKNSTKLWGAGDVRELAILFYSDEPAAFAIDGIEIDGKATGAN